MSKIQEWTGQEVRCVACERLSSDALAALNRDGWTWDTHSGWRCPEHRPAYLPTATPTEEHP